jgi:hypothetical protein
MRSPAPDWYPDPQSSGIWRYWNGQAWTDHRWEGPPQAPPRMPSGLSARSVRWSRLFQVVSMAGLGLVAALLASVFFDGFAYFLEPVEAEDPSTQRLEVVADSCLLHAGEVGPGSDFVEVGPGAHPVVVLTEESRLDPGLPRRHHRHPAFRVLIKNQLGMVVFDTVVQPDDETEETANVQLDTGVYRVECRGPAGTTNAAELSVGNNRD